MGQRIGARDWTSPEKFPALEDSRKRLCPPPHSMFVVRGMPQSLWDPPSSAPNFQGAPGYPPPLPAQDVARAFGGTRGSTQVEAGCVVFGELDHL